MHQLDINNEITKDKHCIEDIRHLFTSALTDLYKCLEDKTCHSFKKDQNVKIECKSTGHYSNRLSGVSIVDADPAVLYINSELFRNVHSMCYIFLHSTMALRYR